MSRMSDMDLIGAFRFCPSCGGPVKEKNVLGYAPDELCDTDRIDDIECASCDRPWIACPCALAMNDHEKELVKRYGLNDVVTCFDADGNHYRRKIRIGLKRGEMYLARSKDGVGCAYLVAQPDGINLTNLETFEAVRHALEPGTRFVFPLTEQSFFDAQSLGAS